MADYSKYPNMDVWLDHVIASKGYQSADTKTQQAALTDATGRYAKWYADQHSPKEGSIEGEHLQPSAAPTTETTDKPPVEKEQPQQLDVAGKVKAGAEKLAEKVPSGPSMGGHLGGMVRLGASLLPEDNAQAFIDTFTLGTLAIPGYGEWEGLGWATKLAMRTAATSAAGAAGGAVQGGEAGAEAGAKKGAIEQVVGEGITGVGRGVTAIGRKAGGAFINRAAQATEYSTQDVQRVSSWLEQRFKNFPGMKNMSDWAETFNQGGLKKSAQTEMDKVDKKVASAIEDYAKPKTAPKAPSQKPAFAKGEDVPTQRRTLNEKIDEMEKKMREAGRIDPETDKLLQEYRAKRSQLGLSNQPQKPTVTINTPGAPPTLKDPTKLGGPAVQLKGIPPKIAKKYGIARGAVVDTPLQTAIDVMHDVEDIGWNMSKGTPVETSKGVAARSAAIQIEHDIASAMEEILGKPGLATEWYTARLRQREANVLHKLLGADNIIDKVTGNLNSHVIMSEASSQQLYMDLEGAVGPEEARNFVSMIGRKPGPITTTDQPAKAFSASVSVHPSLETGIYPRVWLHPGHAPIRIAGQNLPYDLGPGRALTAAMILGPDRFIHMLGDMLPPMPSK